MKQLFLVLTVIGIIVPYFGFGTFLLKHGLNLQLFIEHAQANAISIFAWLDVIISAIVLLTAVFVAKLITSKQGLLVLLATCLSGTSAGLPLFFYFYFSRGQKI